MCLQCTTQAVTVHPDIIPGFTLMQSKVDSKEWPAGWYGLVESNDPSIVFPGPLLKDPTFGMTDDQLNALPVFPPGYQEFTDAADVLGEHLVLPARDGYCLFAACKSVGYSDAEHGFVHYWLLQHMATAVESNPQPSES
jgi:hypothetical protein